MLFVEHYGDFTYLIHSSVSATTVGFLREKTTCRYSYVYRSLVDRDVYVYYSGTSANE